MVERLLHETVLRVVELDVVLLGVLAQSVKFVTEIRRDQADHQVIYDAQDQTQKTPVDEEEQLVLVDRHDVHCHVAITDLGDEHACLEYDADANYAQPRYHHQLVVLPEELPLEAEEKHHYVQGKPTAKLLMTWQSWPSLMGSFIQESSPSRLPCVIIVLIQFEPKKKKKQDQKHWKDRTVFK
eukprot:CAMPEP_0182519490 /NCGR_PEP_ID=MMETSP1321-20130603/45127_1 /TAXON_ID=91990 /ORGANISM="Bolidomonas sp., Strain RCC1657" /LENGTH=182 /DNA_ID=CAMNT_0024727471 /DNA_START=1135 /DNA_END=1684 /DNA_ORIENTATION=+